MINKKSWKEIEKRIDPKGTMKENWIGRVKDVYIEDLPNSKEEYLERFVSDYNDQFENSSFVDYETSNGEREYCITVIERNGSRHQVDASPFKYAVHEANLKESYPEFLANEFEQL